MGSIELAAEWALFGKQRGDMDDYRILAASQGKLKQQQFLPLVQNHHPGTPSPQRRGPGELPWITFSGAVMADTTVVGVAVMSLSDEVDAGGRPIAPTRYLCVSYADLAAGPIGFPSLARAAERTVLPSSLAGAVRLTTERMEPAAVARSIDRVGFDAIAAVAALVLMGPVALTNSGALLMGDRLEWLECVLSLLPYGIRARMSASTWADTRKPIRLTFAARAAEDQSDVDVARPGRTVVRQPDADDYRRALHWYCEQEGTLAVVSRLAKSVEAIDVDGPNALSRCLASLETEARPRGRTPVRRSTPGQGTPPSTGAATQVFRIDLAVLSELASLRPAVPQGWDEGAWECLVETAQGALRGTDDTELARRCLAVTGGFELAETLLETLLVRVALTPPDRSGERLAALIASTTRERLAAGVAPADAMPRVRDRIVERGDAVCLLVVREIESGRAAALAGLLEWLVHGSGPGAEWAARMQHAIDPSGDTPGRLEAFRQLVMARPAVYSPEVRAICALADAMAALVGPEDAIAALWAWTTSEADRMADEHRRALAATVRHVAASTSSADSLARADLMCMLLVREPVAALPARVEAGAGVYAGAFARAMEESHLERWKARLDATLAAHLRGSGWARPLERAEALLALLASTFDPGERPCPEPIVQAVAEAAAEHPRIATLPVYQRRWATLVDGSRAAAAALALARIGRGYDDHDTLPGLARQCAVVLRDGDRGPEVLAALRASGRIRSAADVDVLLAAVRVHLGDEQVTVDRQAAICGALIEGVLDGGLGEDLASSYAAWTRTLAAPALRLQARMLRRLVESMGQEERNSLDRAVEDVRDAARTGRRLFGLR